jgi:AdoMet-dependent heme synthase
LYVTPQPSLKRSARFLYPETPLLLYWEVTAACDLACRHCRAAAVCDRDPAELSEAEARRFLEQVRQFPGRPPVVVMTGGDPMRRPDLFDLIAYARALGLPVALAPSVTPLLTAEALQAVYTAGVRVISLSLDGAGPLSHDGIRGVPGCYDRTVAAIRDARAAGLQVQVNTLVTAGTIGELPAICAQLREIQILRWSLFFLIHVGRGTLLPQITPEEAEAVSLWMAQQAEEAPFEIKATELPQFRRVALAHRLSRGATLGQVLTEPLGRGFGIRDGNGILFVSHTGEVYPSGFLPLSAGNVREQSVTVLYRDSPLLVSLRDPDLYSGKCGQCKYRALCGGSRARAWAATGNPLGSDPLCPYEPDGEELA